jgi:hypothetical protein
MRVISPAASRAAISVEGETCVIGRLRIRFKI